jgi:hypothetical protein
MTMASKLTNDEWAQLTHEQPFFAPFSFVRDRIDSVLARRPEAPAETSCDNSSGQKVIAVPSCAPAPRTFPQERWTKHEIAEAIRSNYHYTEPGDGELFITKILAALDPPKPKTPEERVEVFSMGVNNEGDERVWVVLVDKNRDHPKTCYGLREDVAKAYGSTLRAELAKERP